MTKRIWIDPGSSGSKAFVYDGFCRHYFIEPGVQEVVSGSLVSVEYEIGAGLLSVGDRTYRIGRRPVVCCSSSMKAPDLALKLLAIVGSIDQGRGDSYQIGVMLPLNEFLSMDRFLEEVEEMLPKAKYGDEPIKAKILEIKVHPEGSGLLPQSSGRQLALMVGHTDMSKIYFEDGGIEELKSRTYSEVGVGAIAQNLQIQGHDADIARLLSKGKIGELGALNNLDSEYLEAKVAKRVDIFIAQKIKPYFEAYDWTGLKMVYVGGGGAKFMFPYLKELIPHGITVKKLSSPPGMELFGTKDLRFNDIYGMAYRDKFMRDRIEQLLKGDTEVKSVEVEVA